MSPLFPDEARWFSTHVQPHDAVLRAWLRARFPALGDAADDLVQETYARVLQLRARDPLRAHAVKPLLFTTARHLALDQFRRRQLVPMEALGNFEADAFVDEAPGVGETVSRRQELALLAEAIQSLPERCRQVLTLRKIYGLPQKEIARLLGIAEHTVEAQVGVGVRRCADYLARLGLP